MASTEPEPPFDASTSATSTKRRIDEVFDALDDVLHPRDRPSSHKRVNTSIYGSLAKYGVQAFNKPVVVKSDATPTLSALLTRSRTRKQRKPLVMPQVSKSSPSIPDYSPSSTEAFLQRLATFSLSTYPPKPPQIDAVAASKAGWINEGGKDRLYCAICKVGWIIAGRDGMNKEAGNALVEKQQKSLVEMHKEGCPWRVRQCDPLVYRIPLQSPTNLARQIRSQAAELETFMDAVAICHPLSSTQVKSLLKTIASVPAPSAVSTPPPDGSEPPQPLPLSTNAVLTSLFGWTLLPAPPPISHKSSSASFTLALTHSRASSVPNIVGSSREATPASSVVGAPSRLGTCVDNGDGVESQGTRIPGFRHREPPKPQDALLLCPMCQRRVGLWAFIIQKPSTPSPSQQTSSAGRPQKHFDILREHRSYCPYVVKSTPLPSVPSQSHPPSPPPSRSSFSLTRTGTSSSVTEGQNPASTFNLRRTSSLLSGASSLARTGIFPSSAPPASASQHHNLVEGWRAVLSVVLRYGIAERSRVLPQSPNALPTIPCVGDSVPGVGEKDEDDAMSGVVALVDGVKKHGGKQLLEYVRSLLG